MEASPDLITKLFLGAVAIIQGLFGILYKAMREDVATMQAKVNGFPELYVSKRDSDRSFDRLDQRITESHKETMEAIRGLDAKIDRRMMGGGK